MAWNESGNGKNKDPWGGGSNNNNQGPPDLDEALRKFQQKISRLFGSKGTGSGQNKGSSGAAFSGISIGIVVVVLAIIYGLSGIYIVKPAERAAEFTFGKYTKTVGPGPHWIARFIQSKTIVNVDRVMISEHSGTMLTRGENIVDIDLTVQYKVGSLSDFLFNVADPVGSLRQAADSAMRQVIGQSDLEDALTTGRQAIRNNIRIQLEEILGSYRAGIEVTDVAVLPARPPEAVKDAFDDAIKAQEDEERSKNQALAYRETALPAAQGRARRDIAEAEAYREQVVLESEGNTARFLAILPEYERSPQVTRDRLYLDVMEQVLSESSKVIVDSSSNSLLYLPLDRVMGGDENASVGGSAAQRDRMSSLSASAVASAATQFGQDTDSDGRGRAGRTSR